MYFKRDTMQPYKRVVILILTLSVCAFTRAQGSYSEAETFSSSHPDTTASVRKLHIKTNTLGLGLAMANAGVEVDLCKHMSFNLPIYYSSWNYFSPTVKFRTLSTQPELRYWFSSKSNDGLFAGAHFGIGYYNVAIGGEYRTQDHDGRSPAVGGGLSVGYRMPISRNGRWRLEFTVGGGAYSLHHDKFRNIENGLLVYSERRTYIGPDRAGISISYSFDMKKRDKAQRRAAR